MPIPAFIGGALAGAALVGLLTSAFRNNEETDTEDEEYLDGHESNGTLSGICYGFDFEPGKQKRDKKIKQLFECIAGRSVAVKIMDPYCGVQQQNRKFLAKFVAAVSKAGVNIEMLIFVWDPDIEKADPTDFNSQQEALRDELQSVKVEVPLLKFVKKTHGRDFHDRFMLAYFLDDGKPILARWHVTSGIDRLMSPLSECSVYIKENTKDRRHFHITNEIKQLLRRSSASRH